MKESMTEAKSERQKDQKGRTHYLVLEPLCESRLEL
jgi:hypothetical protein